MIFDIIFIEIICIFAVVGYRKGMLYSLFSIFGITLSLYLSYILSPTIINLICRLLNSNNSINCELDKVLQDNSNIISFANFILRSNNNDMRSISLYTLIIVLSYLVVLLLLKYIIGKLIKNIYNCFCNKIVFARCDSFLGVLCGTTKGLIFIFLFSIIIIIANSINIFDAGVLMQIKSSSLIDFSYNVFKHLIR